MLVPVYASEELFGCGSLFRGLGLSFPSATLGLGRLVRPSHPGLSSWVTVHVFVLSCMFSLEGLSPSASPSFTCGAPHLCIMHFGGLPGCRSRAAISGSRASRRGPAPLGVPGWRGSIICRSALGPRVPLNTPKCAGLQQKSLHNGPEARRGDELRWPRTWSVPAATRKGTSGAFALVLAECEMISDGAVSRLVRHRTTFVVPYRVEAQCRQPRPPTNKTHQNKHENPAQFHPRRPRTCPTHRKNAAQPDPSITY